MTQTDAYDALMLDYATGAVSDAEHLLVETHLGLKPAAAAYARALEALGGVLLEDAPPASLAAAALPHGREAGRAAPRPVIAEARRRVAMAIEGGPGLSWRWRPALREQRLAIAGARLLKIPAGASMPRHGHTGEEVTLVLRGAFEDETGRYAAGDIAFADESDEHAPRVVGGEDCVCLAAMRGGFRFRSPLAGLAAWALQ